MDNQELDDIGKRLYELFKDSAGDQFPFIDVESIVVDSVEEQEDGSAILNFAYDYKDTVLLSWMREPMLLLVNNTLRRFGGVLGGL